MSNCSFSPAKFHRPECRPYSPPSNRDEGGETIIISTADIAPMLINDTALPFEEAYAHRPLFWKNSARNLAHA